MVYLEVELSGGLFELGKISGQFGERNVDGCADGGSQVGWAEGQETVFVVVREWNPLLDFVDGVDQTGIDGLQVTTLLHRDDAQVIFLIAPDQEGLVDVVVDTTTSGPVAASVGSLEETISFLEEETILDELGLDFLGHTSQWVISSLEFTFQACQAGDDFLFHLLVVGLSQAGVESIAGQGATATDAGGDDESALNIYKSYQFDFITKSLNHFMYLGIQVAESLEITKVPGWVSISGLESGVVVADHGFEQIIENAVGFSIRGVDTESRVQILNTLMNSI